MDCPSEEQLIRAALASAEDVVRLEFDLASRSLHVWHSDGVGSIEERLARLDLGAEVEESLEVDGVEAASEEGDQTGVLRILLAINAAMFAVELVAGLVGQSAGLLSDALDMLADALVYGIALWAVGKGGHAQRLASRVSGWCQMALAMGLLSEVARRGLVGSAPEAPMMVGTATLALIANVACVVLLARHRHGGLHMRASWIFSTNDVMANAGVMVAGGLVYWTGSSVPDLVIGTAIALLVMRGARRILRLGRETP